METQFIEKLSPNNNELKKIQRNPVRFLRIMIRIKINKK